MLKNVFQSVWVMSAVGSAVLLLLLALRPMTRKHFSPNWQYYIWLLALNTLVFPWARPSSEVLYVPRTNPLVSKEVQEPIRQFAEALERPATGYAFVVDWALLLAFVWLLGVVFVFSLKMARYALFRGELLDNSLPDDQVYALPKGLAVRRTWLLDAPLIIGLFKPTLYLPEGVPEEDLPYILAHETMHYKRRDLLFKWYAQLVFSIHWFNPLMALLSRQIDAECEASCDFMVTRHWESTETDHYMNMILKRCSDRGRYRLLTTRMASGKSALKRRFFAIRKGGRQTRKTRLLSVGLALSLLLLSQGLGGALAKTFLRETVVIPVGVAAYPERPTEAAVSPAIAEQAPITAPEPVVEPLSQEMVGTAAEQVVGYIEPDSVPTEKILTYNSDERVVQTTTVYPDADGVIRIRFDSPEPRAVAEIEIRNVDHPGGWGYTLPTDPATAYEFGGFDPNEAYAVTVNAYCPGNYGIEGEVLIY